MFQIHRGCGGRPRVRRDDGARRSWQTERTSTASAPLEPLLGATVDLGRSLVDRRWQSTITPLGGYRSYVSLPHSCDFGFRIHDQPSSTSDVVDHYRERSAWTARLVVHSGRNCEYSPQRGVGTVPWITRNRNGDDCSNAVRKDNHPTLVCPQSCGDGRLGICAKRPWASIASRHTVCNRRSKYIHRHCGEYSGIRSHLAIPSRSLRGDGLVLRADQSGTPVGS